MDTGVRLFVHRRLRAVARAPEIQALSAAAEADPAAWADLNSRFDNRAALAFYRELSELPPDFLVSNLPCPLFAFWGGLPRAE